MDDGSPRFKLDLNKKISEASSMNYYHPNSQNPAMQAENGTSSIRQMTSKPRRNWTDQLHLHFLQAVEFLGGAQVATPKLIKQAMKVEGLTDNEIKSHLQAYRKKLAKDKKREMEEEDIIWENGLHSSISKLDHDIDDCCSTNGK